MARNSASVSPVKFGGGIGGGGRLNIGGGGKNGIMKGGIGGGRILDVGTVIGGGGILPLAAAAN